MYSIHLIYFKNDNVICLATLCTCQHYTLDRSQSKYLYTIPKRVCTHQRYEKQAKYHSKLRIPPQDWWCLAGRFGPGSNQLPLPEPWTGLWVRFRPKPELWTTLLVRFCKSSVRTELQNWTLTPLATEFAQSLLMNVLLIISQKCVIATTITEGHDNLNLNLIWLTISACSWKLSSSSCQWQPWALWRYVMDPHFCRCRTHY